MARKNLYLEKVAPYLNLVIKWGADGITEEEIRKRLGVKSPDTWASYKDKNKELRTALEHSRGNLVGKAVNKLAIAMQKNESWAIMYILNNYGGYMTKYQEENVKNKKEANEIAKDKVDSEIIIKEEMHGIEKTIKQQKARELELNNKLKEKLLIDIDNEQVVITRLVDHDKDS